jgi:hypothetical protein
LSATIKKRNSSENSTIKNSNQHRLQPASGLPNADLNSVGTPSGSDGPSDCAKTKFYQ